MTGWLALLKTVPQVSRGSVLVNKSWSELPWTEKACFFILDTGQRSRLLKLTKNIYLPKEVTGHLYCILLSSASKGEADLKDKLWLNLTFSWGTKKAMTHLPKLTHFEQSLCRGKGKVGFSLVCGFFSAHSSKATPHSADRPRGAAVFQAIKHGKEYLSRLTLSSFPWRPAHSMLSWPHGSPGSVQNTSANNGRMRTFHKREYLDKGRC